MINDWLCSNEKCNHIWEVIRIGEKDEDDEEKCPKCVARGIKQVGASSFRLYGEGFYKRNHRDTDDFS